MFLSQPAWAQQEDQAAQEENSAKTLEINEDISIQLEFGAEAQYNWERDFDDVRMSSYSLTVTPGAELQAYDWFLAKGVLEYANETDISNIVVDEAFVQLGNENVLPLFLRVGYYTSPFGNFSSEHIADPLPDATFEVKGDVVEVFYGSEEAFKANVFLVKGRRDRELVRFWGEAAERQNQKWHPGAGLSYVHGFSEDTKLKTEVYVTDSIYAGGDLIGLVPNRDGRLGGSAKVGVEHNGYTASIQYAAAFENLTFVEEAEEEDEEDTIVSSKPAALAVELMRTYEIGDYNTFAALGYSRTWGLANVQPEHQALITIGIEKSGVQVSAEYGRQWGYSDEEEGRKTAEFFGAKLSYSW